MNTVLDWLSGGDLRSDGAADQATEAVLQHPALIGDLVAGLDSPDAVIKGRTADEKLPPRHHLGRFQGFGISS